MRRKALYGLGIAAAVLLSILIPLGLSAQDGDSAATLDQLARAAMQGQTRAVTPGEPGSFDPQASGNLRDALGAEIVTSDLQIMGDWAFGMVVTKAPRDEHGEPDLRLFLGRRINGAWSVALELSPTFYEWLIEAPAELVPFGPRNALMMANPNAFLARGIADARLSLPYPIGATWTFVGGPHGNGGNAVRPWSAIDLTLPDFNATGPIHAARDGWVYRSSSCPNYIRIDHDGGWSTGYYHVQNERVANGQRVERGQWIGTTSALTGCGGWASGPHVHFTVLQNGYLVNIANHDIGGWSISEGSEAYGGCVTRVRDGFSVCRPYGQMYNDGSIGSGSLDLRYDVNGDNRHDVWAVNQRSIATNSTTLQVVSGTGVGTTLRNTGTGMPQQPDWLNTAFGAGDFNGDKVSDLWVIHRQDGSGRTAFRVMNGANLGWLLADRTTALPTFDNSTAFAVMDYNRDEVPDLWAITPRDASGSVRVRIVSGANPNVMLVDRVTAQPSPSAYADINYAAADYNADGFADLWLINPRDLAGMVSVRVLSGRDWSTVLKESLVPLGAQTTNINDYGFMVADYDQDSFPDLWHVDRRSAVVTVISGRNFSDIFYSAASALPPTNSRDWLILGSDRLRETIPPEMPEIRRLDAETLFNEYFFILRFRASGLAERFTVVMTDERGIEMGRYSFSDSTLHCNANNCFIDTRLVVGSLRDDLRYRVQVIAENAYGASFSQGIPFSVDVPGPVTLYTPGYMSIITADAPPSYVWQHNPQVTRYTFRTRRQDWAYDFKRAYYPWEICDANGICTVTLDHVPLLGDYWWRVVSRDATGGISYSYRFLYDIVPAEMPPEVPAEARGETLDLPPAPETLDPATATLEVTIEATTEASEAAAEAPAESGDEATSEGTPEGEAGG
jgi:LasA protease